ncbi:MAG: flagellar brake domain-containing protein [Lachnospiraceae bacterium]|nr:flagellar brake domain-containing protein [Lachnospiraceae bacterium]
MISKLIKEGDRVDLTPVDKNFGSIEDPDTKVYGSKIVDILSEDRVELLMPMEKTKLILLPIDGEYNLVVYTDSGLYQCFVRIVDRYKSNNMYLLVAEFTSNLRKYQRREYFRFSCALDMNARNLVEEEVRSIEGDDLVNLQPNLPIKRSVIVDISGGGIRFMSDTKYEVGSMVYCSYDLVKGTERKQYEVVGKVLAVTENEKRPGTYEHRVQYVNMDEYTREEIIRFIFEEERKSRRKG